VTGSERERERGKVGIKASHRFCLLAIFEPEISAKIWGEEDR
jgi:hypothetical protein